MLDSTHVFTARLQSVGLSEPLIRLLVAAGINSLAKLAFLAPCQPGQTDDKVFVDAITPLLGFDDAGNKIPPDVLSVMRRIYFEAQAVAMAEVRARVEKTEDSAPRELPLPEREARRLRQQGQLTGIVVAGPLEPSHSIIDFIHNMKEDEILKFVDPAICISRDQELRGSKKESFVKVDPTGKLSSVTRDVLMQADLSSEFRIRQALTRRSLALDQMQLLEFQDSEAYHDMLYALLSTEVPPTHAGITVNQLLVADKHVWMHMATNCRAGISVRPDGSLPMKQALTNALNSPIVQASLQPLPKARGSRDFEGGRGAGKGKGRWMPYSDKESKGSGKGKKGKGKGKGKRVMVPAELQGGYNKTASGQPICFNYNLSGCAAATPGGRCPRGVHLCCKCEGADHTFQTCPKK